MLYLCRGDRFASREIARSIVEVCKKKQPTAEYVSFDSETAKTSLEELAYAQGLFNQKYIVFIGDPPTTILDDIVKTAPSYVSSGHVFVLFDPEIKESAVKALEKAGAKIYTEKKKVAEENGSVGFKIADAFLEKDTEMFFKKLHTLCKSDADADVSIPILFWQMQTLLLARDAKTATEAGLKQFPFSKAKKVSEKFTQDELFNNYMLLDTLSRRQRMENLSYKETLERFVLSL